MTVRGSRAHRRLLLAATLIGAACRRDDDSDAAPPGDAWNVVLVLTDDQRYDTLWAMPEVERRLVAQGVRFDRAYVPTPMCCPSRVSFLSGGWLAKHTGVLTNEKPNGGFSEFADTDTLATRLQANGWATALVGKYLNGYEANTPYVPPGWTRFGAVGEFRTWSDYDWVDGASAAQATAGAATVETTYLTDHIRDVALEFLDDHGDAPFFLVIAAPAPHHPSEPAPGDETAFGDYTFRGGAYQEADVTDKPAFVGEEAIRDASLEAVFDERHRDQLRSLLAVDRLVAAVDDKLTALDVADRTLFVYASDNGFLWGEHRLEGKGYAYEESVRVPLVARLPGGVAGSDTRIVAANVDVAATVVELTELRLGETDGASLVPILRGEAPPSWRDRLPLDNYTQSLPVFSGVVTERWKYVEYVTGEVELYDLADDPYELDNLAAAPPDDAPIDELSTWLAEERGLALTTQTLPDGVVGVPYRAVVEVWGGAPPYRFELDRNAAGWAAIDADTGEITGTPDAEGDHDIGVIVTDASASPWSGEPQRYEDKLTVHVGAPSAVAVEPQVGGCALSARVVAPGGADVGFLLSEDPAFDGVVREVPATRVVGEAIVPLVAAGGDAVWYWRAVVGGRALPRRSTVIGPGCEPPRP